MSFTANTVIFAVPASSMVNVDEAREKYGEPLRLRPLDESSEIVCALLGHKDRDGSDDLRAGVLGSTVTAVALSNGNIAFIGHFAQDFVNALGIDPLLDGCQILTNEEFQSLLP